MKASEQDTTTKGDTMSAADYYIVSQSTEQVLRGPFASADAAIEYRNENYPFGRDVVSHVGPLWVVRCEDIEIGPWYVKKIDAVARARLCDAHGCGSYCPNYGHDAIPESHVRNVLDGGA